MRSVHRESSCSPPCGAGKRLSSVAKLATAPPSDARQRKAMGMSTHGHQQLSEHHAGHAGSHADAKVRYTMLAVLLVVSEPLTANALAPDCHTASIGWLLCLLLPVLPTGKVTCQLLLGSCNCVGNWVPVTLGESGYNLANHASSSRARSCGALRGTRPKCVSPPPLADACSQQRP